MKLIRRIAKCTNLSLPDTRRGPYNPACPCAQGFGGGGGGVLFDGAGPTAGSGPQAVGVTAGGGVGYGAGAGGASVASGAPGFVYVEWG